MNNIELKILKKSNKLFIKIKRQNTKFYFNFLNIFDQKLPKRFSNENSNKLICSGLNETPLRSSL